MLAKYQRAACPRRTAEDRSVTHSTRLGSIILGVQDVGVQMTWRPRTSRKTILTLDWPTQRAC